MTVDHILEIEKHWVLIENKICQKKLLTKSDFKVKNIFGIIYVKYRKSFDNFIKFCKN